MVADAEVGEEGVEEEEDEDADLHEDEPSSSRNNDGDDDDDEDGPSLLSCRAAQSQGAKRSTEGLAT